MAGSIAAKAWSVLRNKWYGLQLDGADNLLVASPVKGAPATVFTLSNPGNATSEVIDARGAIGVIVDAAGLVWTAGSLTLAVQGSVDDTAYAAAYGSSGAGTGASSFTVVSNSTQKTVSFYGIPDYIKIVATGGANISGPVKYQLIY